MTSNEEPCAQHERHVGFKRAVEGDVVLTCPSLTGAHAATNHFLQASTNSDQRAFSDRRNGKVFLAVRTDERHRWWNSRILAVECGTPSSAFTVVSMLPAQQTQTDAKACCPSHSALIHRAAISFLHGHENCIFLQPPEEDRRAKKKRDAEKMIFFTARCHDIIYFLSRWNHERTRWILQVLQ